MDRSPHILNRLPQFMDNDSEGSRIKAIVNAISAEIGIVDDQIEILDNMIGVVTTTGYGLDKKWGKLLNKPRLLNETDMEYRDRLSITVSSLSGGDSYAIRSAVASVFGISKINQVQVVDAWEYTGNAVIDDTSYGNAVCILDLDGFDLDVYNSDIKPRILTAIDKNKASGIKVQLIQTNFGIPTYDKLVNFTYNDLYGITYNRLGVI